MDIILSILEQIVYGLMTGGIYAMIGVGLSMIFGVMRLSNFAHGEFYMLGAYLTYVLVSYMKFDPYVLAPLAAMFVGFVGI
ncbi:MAG: ABC transporter permease subunit, partial [Thermoprotei archaeon]